MGIPLVTAIGQQLMSQSVSVVLASDDPVRTQLEEIRAATNEVAIAHILGEASWLHQE